MMINNAPKRTIGGCVAIVCIKVAVMIDNNCPDTALSEKQCNNPLGGCKMMINKCRNQERFYHEKSAKK